VGQYINKKKVDMLHNPINYLTDRNTALAAVGAATTNTYTAKLDALVDSIAGQAIVPIVGGGNAAEVAARNAEHLAVHNLPWVKQLAAGLTAKSQSADVELVDISFLIQNKAEKFQQSINKRMMAGKRELIEEGS